MHKVMTLVLGLGKVALLAYAANAATPDRATANLKSLLTGDFDTRRQFDAADSALKVPPSVAGRWLDRQHAVMRPVDAPLIGPTVFYLEWRDGGPDGRISRQRIWSIHPGTATMAFYTFRDAAPYAGRGAEPAAFRALRPDQLIGYPAECDVRWTPTAEGSPLRAWLGRIDPAACRMVAQSGRGMRLDVTITATAKGFAYQEKGLLDDGRIAFAVPPTEPYRFERLRSR